MAKKGTFPKTVFVTIGGYDGNQLNAEAGELEAIAYEEESPGAVVVVAVYHLDHVKTSRRTTTEAVK